MLLVEDGDNYTDLVKRWHACSAPSGRPAGLGAVLGVEYEESTIP